MIAHAISGRTSGARNRRIGTPSSSVTVQKHASVRSTNTVPTTPQVHRIALDPNSSLPAASEPNAAIVAIRVRKLPHSSPTITGTRWPANRYAWTIDASGRGAARIDRYISIGPTLAHRGGKTASTTVLATAPSPNASGNMTSEIIVQARISATWRLEPSAWGNAAVTTSVSGS